MPASINRLVCFREMGTRSLVHVDMPFPCPSLISLISHMIKVRYVLKMSITDIVLTDLSLTDHAKMRLLDLPSELVMYIAESLDKDRDILALMRTCRLLSVWLERSLYANNVLLNNSSALWWAAKKGKVSVATSALQYGASPNCMNRGGEYSILHDAAKRHQGPIVELLLQQGADPNMRDQKGLPPLYLCMQHKSNPSETQRAGTSFFSPNSPKWDGVIDLLLAKGADPTFKRLETSILDLAIKSADAVMVKKLLQHGAEQITIGGRCHLFKAVLYNSTIMVEALLQWGANPNYVTPDGDRILHVAAESGNAHIVKVLLAHGAQVNDYTNGDTALHRALQTRYGIQAAKQLLDSGADLELRNQGGFGDTPLQRCAARNNAGGMRLLLRYDADPEIREFFSNASASDYRSHRAATLLSRKGLISRRILESIDVNTSLSNILNNMSLYQE